MDIFSISYLMRYVFVVIIVIVAVKLLISAIKELRWAGKHSLRPAQGYFLLNQQADGSTSSLPLYHTTNIGRARANDLRIHSKEVQWSHATVYRYDGSWFIRPSSGGAFVSINGEKIKDETKLNNNDIIDFGPAEFAFMDEHQIARNRGEVYEESTYDDEAFLRAVKRNSSPLYLEWILINAFAVLATGLVYFMMPDVDSVIQDFLIWTGGAILLIDLYFLFLPSILRYADRILFLAAGQLTIIGFAIQSRLNLIGGNAYIQAETAGDTDEMLRLAEGMFASYRTQIIAVLGGLVVLWLIALLVYRTRMLEDIAKIAAVVTPLLLIITLVFGRGSDTHGATLWLNLGGYSLQLTEFAKITYLITLASFFKNRPPLSTQIKFGVWAAVVFFLYLLLPDLGSIMILLPVTLIIFVVMTSEYLKTFLILAAASVLGVTAYGIFPHVRNRLAGWTSLWEEVNDQNRQVVYGLQAMGRGNFLGRGLGNGSPGGIPLAESDMIYSVVSEEFGLIVAIGVFILLLVILLRGVRTTVLARDGYTSSLALGISSAIFIEAIVVIGGTTGLIPLTGATLPFIAAGGSSLIAKWLMIAILLGLASRQEQGASKYEEA